MTSSRTRKLMPVLVAAGVSSLFFVSIAIVPNVSWSKTIASLGSSKTPTVENSLFFQWPRHMFPADERLDEVVDVSRKLYTAGIPGEGLLLAEVNDDFGPSEVGGGLGDESGTKMHKPLLPLDRADITAALLAILGLMIAAAGGIGGGGMLVPLYVLCLKFNPKLAVPLSNITIFGGAITNAFLNVRKRHPIADRPLVDWDLILVMEPLTIGGALVGSFIQKVLPEFLLTVMMILLLVVTADRTMRKGIKAFKKETVERRKEKAFLEASGGQPLPSGKVTSDGGSLLGNSTKTVSTYGTSEPIADTAAAVAPSTLNGHPSSQVAPASDRDIAPDDDEESATVLISTSPSSPMTEEDSSKEDVITLKDILDEEKNVSASKITIMSLVFVVILIVNLLKGGGGFKSPLGIECGSPSFWITSALSILWVLAVSLRVRKYLVNRWRLKDKLGYTYVEGDVEWTPVNTIRYPAICFFAGFFAGMFGVGGGIVKGPLMLEMGVHPMVAAATSAVMILYTSFTATTSFVVFGLLRMDYAVPLFIIGLCATAVGQWGTEYLVKKFKRPSVIILSIGSVVALSALLMGGSGLMNVFNEDGSVGVEAGGICEAGI